MMARGGPAGRAVRAWSTPTDPRTPSSFRHPGLTRARRRQSPAAAAAAPAACVRSPSGGSDLPLPPPLSPAAEWRAYYLEQDLYEAMNLAPLLLPPDEVQTLHDGIALAMRWSSPLVGSVAVVLPRGHPLVASCGHVRSLVVEAQMQMPTPEPVVRVSFLFSWGG